MFNKLEAMKKKATTGAGAIVGKAGALAEKHDLKGKVATAGTMTKKVVAGAINSIITPEFVAFCKNPSPEALRDNPQIVLTGLTILSVIGSPQASIGKALLVSAAGVSKRAAGE